MPDQGSVEGRAMQALVERIAGVLRRQGWTCEYHEPVSGPGECSGCDDSHQHTAAVVVETLGFTAEYAACFEDEGRVWLVGVRRYLKPETAERYLMHEAPRRMDPFVGVSFGTRWERADG